MRFPRRHVSREDPSHYSHLLKEDQLMREMRQGKSFHGLTEAPIDFPPTYKYSDAARQAAQQGIDTDAEWQWSSHRWPSWCDRILYLESAPSAGQNEQVKAHVYNALPLFPHSDHRPVALAASVPVTHAAGSSNSNQMDNSREAAPFAMDPAWYSRREAARRKEVVVGILAYLGLTWEGNGMLLASTLGIVGAWFVLGSHWDA